MNKVYAPYTIFGRTIDVPVVTYTDGKRDNPPKRIWDKEMWIEREEDWYGLPNKGIVRVVERQEYLKERAKYPDDVFKVPKKNPYNSVSEADFAKWQQYRQQQEDSIKKLTERIGELQDEVRYWQQQAMRSVIRD
jgi:hypothetical protein